MEGDVIRRKKKKMTKREPRAYEAIPSSFSHHTYFIFLKYHKRGRGRGEVIGVRKKRILPYLSLFLLSLHGKTRHRSIYRKCNYYIYLQFLKSDLISICLAHAIQHSPTGVLVLNSMLLAEIMFDIIAGFYLFHSFWCYSVFDKSCFFLTWPHLPSISKECFQILCLGKDRLKQNLAVLVWTFSW
jgi:hypothetical protein